MICDPDGPDMVRTYAQPLKRAAEMLELVLELAHAKDRAAYAERTAAILARRCAEQAKTIAALLAKYEPAPASEVDPIHADDDKKWSDAEIAIMKQRTSQAAPINRIRRPEPDPIHAAVAAMQRQGVR